MSSTKEGAMSIREESFATVEDAIKKLPDTFWFFIGAGKGADWERMTRDELLDMARDDAEMDREEGNTPTLGQPATLTWYDKDTGAIGIEGDETLYEFSTAATPRLPKD
jgi:hypothetical protein